MNEFKLEGLSTEQLREGYQAVYGLSTGEADPTKVEVPDIDDSHMRGLIQFYREMFRGEGVFTQTADPQDPNAERPETPRERITRLANPDNPLPTKAGDDAYLKSMIMLFGVENRLQLYESLNGQPITPNVVVDNDVNATVPNREEVIHEPREPEPTINQAEARMEFNLKALGAENFNDFVIRYQGPLQREFGNGFSELKFTNDDGTPNLVDQQKALTYIIENTDQTEILRAAAAPDASRETIMTAQSIVGAEITGQYDIQTRSRAIDFVKEHNPGLEGFRGHLIGENGERIPSTSGLHEAITNGNLPIIRDALPDSLKIFSDDQLRAPPYSHAFAAYLTNEENFTKYDAAVRELDTKIDLDLRETFSSAHVVDPHPLSIQTSEVRAEFGADISTESKVVSHENVEAQNAVLPNAEAYNSVIQRLTPDMATNQSLPPELRDLARMKTEFDAATLELSNYRNHPMALNTDNPWGFEVTGFVNAPYGPIVQKLQNAITSHETAMMERFAGLTDTQKQGILTRLDATTEEPDAGPLRDQPPVRPPNFQAPVVSSAEPGTLATFKEFAVNSFTSAYSTLFGTNEAAAAPKVEQPPPQSHLHSFVRK